LSRFGNVIMRAEVIVAGIFVAAMVIMVFTGGVARLMRMPVNATIDFATCFFAWATFLSADIAWRRSRLTALRFVPDALPASLRWWLDSLNYLTILAILGYGVYAGTILAWISRSRTFQGMPDISYSWVTAALPVGCALMILTTLEKLVAHFRTPGVDEASVQET
jgi:TRAP-type C4-dicarboxylate transport system permease small subunit